MKNKLIITITSFALIFVTIFAFVGCKKTNIKSSNTTENVDSNGGAVVTNNNVIYFVNGTSDEVNNENIIYSAKISESGTLEDVKPFVKSFAGLKYNSLYIFGEYLYFVTPSTAKNADGVVQSDILKFCRVKLSGGKIQTIYQVNSADDADISYAYYPAGEKDLFLVVYNASTKNIISVAVGTNPTKKVIANNVKSVLFAENGQTNGANQFVYYIVDKDKTQANQTGNIVKKISPNGDGEEVISSESKTFSLITIVDGKLIYSDASYIYITDNKIDTRENRVLSYSSTSTYDQIKYYSDKLVVKDSNKHILIISWADGHINTTTVCENVDAKFIGTKENKLFYTVSSVLYVVDLAENAEPLKLCEKTIDTAEGNIAPEIVGNYLYFMHTEDDSTVAYRVNIDAAELQTAEKLVG